MCFRDRTFCSATCLNASCVRRWTDELQAQADAWWDEQEGPAPVAFADFSIDARCVGHFDEVTTEPDGTVRVLSRGEPLYVGRPTMDGASE